MFKRTLENKITNFIITHKMDNKRIFNCSYALKLRKKVNVFSYQKAYEPFKNILECNAKRCLLTHSLTPYGYKTFLKFCVMMYYSNSNFKCSFLFSFQFAMHVIHLAIEFFSISHSFISIH